MSTRDLARRRDCFRRGRPPSLGDGLEPKIQTHDGILEDSRRLQVAISANEILQKNLGLTATSVCARVIVANKMPGLENLWICSNGRTQHGISSTRCFHKSSSRFNILESSVRISIVDAVPLCRQCRHCAVQHNSVRSRTNSLLSAQPNCQPHTRDTSGSLMRSGKACCPVWHVPDHRGRAWRCEWSVPLAHDAVCINVAGSSATAFNIFVEHHAGVERPNSAFVWCCVGWWGVVFC